MRKDLLIYFISLTVALVFVFLLSVACSPFYGMDSAVFDAGVFQTIGFQWSKGHLPYSELWDHKGPLIFLFNALGYSLMGTKTGIMLLEAFSISIFIYYSYKALRTNFNIRASIIGAGITILLLAGTYAGGDNVEEIILPLLSYCFYRTCQWIAADKQKHVSYGLENSVLIGLLLAVGLLTRLTNVAAGGGILLGVCILATKEKYWKDVFMCIGGTIIGFIVLIMPFVMYFYSHGIISEAVQCILGFNGSYATTTNDFPLVKYISHMISTAPCYFLLALSSASVFCFKQKHSMLWLFATALTMAWLLPSRMFLKYSIIGVPFFPILLIELASIMKSMKWNKNVRFAFYALVALIPLTTLRFIHSFKNEEIVILTNHLEKDIDNNAKFIAYETPTQVCLNLGVMPCYRFFYGQDNLSTVSLGYESEMLKEFESCKAEWILMKAEQPRIEYILNRHYYLFKEYEDLPGYKLYRRQER